MTFNEVKIVAQKAWRATPKKPLIAIAVLFALPLLGVLTAFGIAPDTSLEKIERHVVIQPLDLPGINTNEIANETSHSESFNAVETVQRGDSVGALLARLNVDDNDAFEFLRTNPAARSIYQLRPGRAVEASTNADGELLSLRYFHGGDQFLQVSRSAAGLQAEEKSLDKTVQNVYKSGHINSSLFAATDSAKIPDAIAMQLARIFSTDIDFHIDLRKGDSFSVIYEMLYHGAELVSPGRVLSAQFVNNGKTYEAFLFSDNQGHDGYYSADGQSRAKSFLRSPLEFSRVSSNFGGRLHPIFKNWRAHTGVDFAAPKGTQVWASADGVVEYAGVKGGYGNVVEIRHNAGITTLYGHLSAFARGMHKGLRVQQGQVIAYVGATGWATGPHLHYEFKISGMHHDPLKVALPKADPLPARYRSQFIQAALSQVSQLALLRDSHDAGFE